MGTNPHSAGETTAPTEGRGIAALPWRWRIWLGLGAVLVLVYGIGAALAAGEGERFTGVLLVLWLVGTGLVGLRHLWHRLTYRISVRLFFSYLLVSVVPFLLFALFGFVIAYMFIGQYASARYADQSERSLAELRHLALRAVEYGDARSDEAALELLRRASATPPDPLPSLAWFYADGGRHWSSPTLEGMSEPSWLETGGWSGPFLVEQRPFLGAVHRQGKRLAAVFLPLDHATAQALSEKAWYDVRFSFTRSKVTTTGEERGIAITLERGATQAAEEVEGKRPGSVTIAGEPVPRADVEEGWIPKGPGQGGLIRGEWVVWFRIGSETRDWASGAMDGERRVVALLKTSPAAAANDLFRSPYQMQEGVMTAAVAMAVFFALLYGIAVVLAGLMIVSITRYTSRLTRGAREVARGNLAVRVPVRRRDQLGDLATSFNGMAEAVQRMLVEVKEKERISHELELARRIQQSLLPRAAFREGALAVEAHFRPAAEIGGDYFDVFRLAPGRVLTVVGDVAGHGLSTGLHMAMVKSAVVTLVREGYRGVQLMEQLNELILDQSLPHRMVTLVLASFDLPRGSVEVVSAGHPSTFLIDDDAVRELELPSLPLGYHWQKPPASTTAAFPPGSRLLLFSDGLVEARDGEDHPLGYDGLAAGLDRIRHFHGRSLLGGVVGLLEEQVDGASLADDVTVVVVENTVPAAAAPPQG